MSDTGFPKPPASVLECLFANFEPANEVRDWVFGSFIEDGAVLRNPDHEHLQEANILFLWASYPEKRTGQYIAGTAQFYNEQTTKWSQGRSAYQVREWNGGETPDFIITLCAPYAQEASPEAICALVEHELYHCGQERDEFGTPKFLRDSGRPVFAMRGHDLEEFVGVIARYGAFSPQLEKIGELLNRPPQIKRTFSEQIVCGCGSVIA